MKIQVQGFRNIWFIVFRCLQKVEIMFNIQGKLNKNIFKVIYCFGLVQIFQCLLLGYGNIVYVSIKIFDKEYLRVFK